MSLIILYHNATLIYIGYLSGRSGQVVPNIINIVYYISFMGKYSVLFIKSIRYKMIRAILYRESTPSTIYPELYLKA